MLIFIHFYWFDQKHLLKQIQIFLRSCPFSNMVRKTNFCVFQWSFLRYSFLCLKWKVLYEFPAKYFKTTQRHSFAVCGLLCGEKQFLLIFIRFYWFNQKKFLKQIQIFLRIYPFSNMVRKRNSLSFSVLVSEIVILCLKRKVLYIYPLLLIWSKTVVYTNPNFLQDLPLFKHGKKNKLSEYFSACFWDSHFYV